MKPVVWRFVVMAALFVGWLGYLCYLVLALPKSPNGLPPVLSRPQFLVSDLDVVGDIEDEAGAVTAAVGAGAPIRGHAVKVREVLYPPDSKLHAGDVIYVTNFGECVIPPDPTAPATTKPAAPLPTPLSKLGSCLLPLRSLDGGSTWQVSPLPPSPLFGGQAPRIYPADKETLAQYRQIGK